MRIFHSTNEIKSYLKRLSDEGQSTGFVPTMGALHQGHLSLIDQAKGEVDQVICSIFVNPLQFNRREDLEHYPKREAEDEQMLKSVECDILFMPSAADIYPKKPDLSFNFGSIGKGMEADYRPGHFQGVAAVIQRFLEILSPDKAYFGEKDFQQLAIVRWLVQEKNFPTEIVGCPTKRNKNGLALSSRNYLLNGRELNQAAAIYQALHWAAQEKKNYSPMEVSSRCRDFLNKKGFEVEYFVIADERSMKPIKSWKESACPRAFVAANLSGVRLIDNLSLNV